MKMNKIIGLIFICMLLLSSTVLAINVGRLKFASTSSGLVIEGTLYDNNRTRPSIVENYCMHNNITYNLGIENLSWSYSPNGLTDSYLMYGRDNNCTYGDFAWIIVNNEFTNTTISSGHHHRAPIIVINPVDAAFTQCKANALEWYTSSVLNEFCKYAIYRIKLVDCRYAFDKANCENLGNVFIRGRCVSTSRIVTD